MTHSITAADNLIRLREKVDMTQDDFADLIGIPSSEMSLYECNRKPISPSVKTKLESALDVQMPVVDDPREYEPLIRVNKFLFKLRDIHGHTTAGCANHLNVVVSSIYAWEDNGRLNGGSAVKATQYAYEAEQIMLEKGVRVAFLPETKDEYETSGESFYDAHRNAEWVTAFDKFKAAKKPKLQPRKAKLVNIVPEPEPVTPIHVMHESDTTEHKRLALIRIFVSATDDKLNMMSAYAHIIYNELYGELR